MTRRDERGSGSVLVVAALGVVVVLSVAGLQVGAAASAAHRARAAADLSVLAAATAEQEGQPDPCAHASDLARRNGAELVECVRGVAESVEVRVSTTAAVSWPGVAKWAVATARAGPSDVARENR